MSVFKNSIITHTKDFTSYDVYKTITRKNGSEIITVTDGKIVLTRLHAADNETTKAIISKDLSFQPIEILMNECEQLLCVYDQSNCVLFSLNAEGSKFSFPIQYKVSLNLTKNEKVLQVIFNNVSKFQSEIVVLTTKEIRCYNINISLHNPVLRYDFEKEYEINTSPNTYDLNANIVDPVSICFATCPANSAYEFETVGKFSNNSPQNDLTLLLLTSDASIYKIYPFFPYELSVSKEWMSDLFDSTSLIFKSVDKKRQMEMLPTIKATSFLQNLPNSNSIVISDAVPSVYRKGKITGPLSMESFPEELYAFEAIKILSLPNDILVIIFNHTVIVFNRSSTSTMIFENQTTDSADALLLLDSIIFSEHAGDVCTATLHPVTRDCIFIIGSNGSLFQIDFSQWMDVLSVGLNSGDLGEFNELCQEEKLPTEVILLGKVKLNTETKPSSEFALRMYENNIWFAWNTRDVYAMAIKQGTTDVLSLYLVSTTKKEELEELKPEVEPEKVSSIKKNGYKSLLPGSFKQDELPQIKVYLSKISEINNAMRQFPNILLNENSANASDLEIVNNLSELVSSGQLILFRVLSTISQRLRQMTVEYHNQINTYHQITLQKQDVINRFFRLKTAYADAADRQELLIRKMQGIMKNVEELETKNNYSNISFSYQENAYFKELSRIRDFTQKKQNELTEINTLLDNVKKAEIEVLLKNKETVLKNFDNKRTLDDFKEQLEGQSSYIEFLVNRLNDLSLR